jgi:2-phospho-L-lactate transferase/gluconeogenesis factor (CofD/UPF0052 family)
MDPGSSAPQLPLPPDRRVRVVLFSGGRGSGALSKRLVTDPNVSLTIAINGYDDGASTGRVRRFLGDCLGPSDFRKNASHVARELSTAPHGLIALLDMRLPAGCVPEEARAALAQVRVPDGVDAPAGTASRVRSLAESLAPDQREAVVARLAAFERERAAAGREFDYSDCAIGNLVFAGSFLLCHRVFNDAVDDYAGLVGLPAGLIEDVTDGTNAYLVALDASGELLATEEAIVDARRRNRVRDIFLIRDFLREDEQAAIRAAAPEDRRAELERRARPVSLNPRLAARLAEADLIVYAPGTQHSSLFPSYLTPGLGEAIAANLGATKLLVTNIQVDAEIAGSSAVDIIDRALFYLEQKGQRRFPTPALISHYLINEPQGAASDSPYVPLGEIDALDDPRLVRIGHYEDGVSGRHDAARLLAPFLESFLTRGRPPRVAVVLHDARSQNKLCQTLLELIRGGITEAGVDVSVFHDGSEDVDAAFTSKLPFPVVRLDAAASGIEQALRRHLAEGGFDYVALFESSGMYRGEDVVSLILPLKSGRLGAVWGSRRLSVRDMEESYRLRYRHKWLLGTASATGSYLLSLAYLVLYGRYVSDTLSGARAMRAAHYLDSAARLDDKRNNQELLSTLMRNRAEIQEVYVRFVALSPERVKRTTVLDGLASVLTILRRRFSGPPGRPSPEPRRS